MASVCRAPFPQQKRKVAVESEMIFTAVMLNLDIDRALTQFEIYLRRLENNGLLFRIDHARRELNFEFAVCFRKIDRSHAQRQLVVKTAVRRRRDVFAPISHAVPVSVPVEGELFAEASHFLESVAETVVARERPFQQ